MDGLIWGHINIFPLLANLHRTPQKYEAGVSSRGSIVEGSEDSVP